MTMTNPCPPCKHEPCACDESVAFQQQIGLAWHDECYDSGCTRLRYHPGEHVDEYMVDAPELEPGPGQSDLPFSPPLFLWRGVRP